MLSNNEFITKLDSSNNYGRYKFRDDRKDFDGIYANPIVGYEPERQLWDGLDKKEKSEMTLITKNTEIKKEIKDKKTGKLMPIQGVRFCQKVDYKLSQGEEQYCSEPTNENGITWLEIDKMAYGKSTLVEKFDAKVYKIDPDTKGKTETEVKQAGDPVKIYVDLGTRFLGETSGNDLITYQGLVEQIEEKPLEEINKIHFMQRKIGQFIENFGNDKNTGGTWLKLYDIRKNKVVYIAKKPVSNFVSWDKLFNAGLVYGLDQLDLSTFKPNSSDTITTIQTNKKYNGKPYIAKAIKIKDRWFIIRLLKTTNSNNPIINTQIINKEIYGSEWNRYILPLIKDNRYEDKINDIIEASLKSNKNEDFTIQLAKYKYNGDLTVGTKEKIETLRDSITGINTITQEIIANQVLGRGGFSTFGEKIRAAIKVTYPSGIQGSNDANGFRPVLEEIPQNCYDGACFEGEVAGTDFITYNKFLSEITGISEDNIKEKQDTNKYLEYKRKIADKEVDVKIGEKLPEGNDSTTGGNWLKIYDVREGKTLYIAKKPLTNNVSWDMLYKAGVVYGLDQIDTSKEALEDFKSTNKLKMSKNYTEVTGYIPTIIKINGKSYIVRLLKTSTQDNPNEPTENSYNEYQQSEKLKNSEWDRYMLPLIKEYRYSENTRKSISEELTKIKDKNETVLNSGQLSDSQEFQYQLAEYNWFGDLTLRPSQDEFIYQGKNQTKPTSDLYKDKNGNFFSKYVGQMSWVQEYVAPINRERMVRGHRGSNNINEGAALASCSSNDYSSVSYGFRPVLEEIAYPFVTHH